MLFQEQGFGVLHVLQIEIALSVGVSILNARSPMSLWQWLLSSRIPVTYLTPPHSAHICKEHQAHGESEWGLHFMWGSPVSLLFPQYLYKLPATWFWAIQNSVVSGIRSEIRFYWGFVPLWKTEILIKIIKITRGSLGSFTYAVTCRCSRMELFSWRITYCI